jgi:UDP-N-acetylglucosamine acyltransferase
MSTVIHATASVEKGAQLADGVRVHADACIGEMISLGKGTHVRHHATVYGGIQMEENNQIHPYAYVGAPTYDLKETEGLPGLKICNGNTFREYCTVHTATKDENRIILGHNNVFLACSRVSHDCIVDNNVIMSRQAALGDNVMLGDFTNIGSSAGMYRLVDTYMHQPLPLGSGVRLSG